MVVTWVTMNRTTASVVEYGRDNLNTVARGSQDVFIDGGSERRHIYMHRVTLSGLMPGQSYGRLDLVFL